ncbi:MAG TPA: DEAD/DEAH box helicase [Sporichthyaceae bacterium]|nr:DEAD/DEAH box helicase [Sporichthyaceae bacterium]
MTIRSGRSRAGARRKRLILTTFHDLGVIPAITDALAEVGIREAFAIQELTLPIALTGTDVIGQARTGTGKTLAFGIPLLQRLVAPSDDDFADLVAPGAPQALVIVPTRELCVQVTGDLELAGRRRGVRVAAIYGGRAYEPQVSMLKAGVEVVVGTPGRLLDLRKQRLLDLSHVKSLVLDEADEMLDLGFLPDVERLISDTPVNRQTMLFSATMPGPVMSLARRYLRSPTNIRAESGSDEMTVPLTVNHVFRTHQLDKIECLARILQARGRQLAMVFAPTRRLCQNIADTLCEKGFAAAAVHGDLGQGAREQALRAFRGGKVDVLVATDVAARGIDVDDVTHVINYECPDDEKTYLHRTGRTGRAGRTGVAVTFVDWADMTRWQLIDKALALGLGQPQETYSTSPHLYSALDIPPEAKGVLPKADRTRAGLDAEHVEDLGETGRARSRSRPTTQSGGGEDKPAVRAPRKKRPRSRTRSGQPVGEPDAAARPAPDRHAMEPAGAEAKARRHTAEPTTGEAEPPRARRRTRGGGGSTRTGEDA